MPVLPPDAVARANQVRAFSADRLLFADRSDDAIAALGEEFKDQGPSWTADFEGPMPEIEVRSR